MAANNDRPRPVPRSRSQQDTRRGSLSSSEGEVDNGYRGSQYQARDPLGHPNNLNDLNAPGNLVLTQEESAISPIDSYDQNRLYSYDVSGSEGDAESDTERDPVRSPKHYNYDKRERRRKKNSHNSLSSEENAHRSQRHLPHVAINPCTGYEEQHYEEPWTSNIIDFTEAPTLPRLPPIPPPPPPPLDESVPIGFNRPRSRHQYTEIDPRPPSGLYGGSDPRSSASDATYYLVQTTRGSALMPPNTQTRAQGRHPGQTVTGQGPNYDVHSNNNVYTPGNNANHTGLNGESVSLRYNSVYSSSSNTPGVPIPYTPVPTFFRPTNKISNAGHRMKKHLKQKCTWKCVAILFILLSLVLAACVAYLVAITVLNLDWQLGDRGSPRLNALPNGTALDTSVTTLPTSTIPTTTTPKPIPRVTLDSPSEERVLPKDSWIQQLDIIDPKFVKFNFTLPDDAVIGVYGRLNSKPTYVQYDFFHMLDGRKISQQRRRRRDESSTKDSSEDQVTDTAFIEYLEPGLWYMMVYNDVEIPNTVSVVSSKHDKVDSTCPKDCLGRGECTNGQCTCFPGYEGWDCSQTVCPVLCNGRGIYVRGECECYSNWKGKECSVAVDRCEVPNCSGNGECIRGECICSPGFKGKDCREVDCIPSNCSGNGVCVQGQCYCNEDHTGSDCSLPRVQNIPNMCRKNCTQHGVYDMHLDACVCEEGWAGEYCEIERCSLQCVHGHCSGQRCVCDEGWAGAVCNQVSCDPRCLVHGFCDNGTCMCNPGWNGKYCSLDGCPRSCSNHGRCQVFSGSWQCNCADGWKGEDCSLSREVQCGDNLDNDEDGLLDCQDPDCCLTVECKDSPHCVMSPDPLEILLRKQPPSSTASFFDKMRFLVEEQSVQKFAHTGSFNESQVSVIRGRVYAKDGTPLIGVRVSVVTQPLYGFTLTRELGLFDILVNGGGSVTLQFQRQPFKTKMATVMVPWNQLVTMESINLVLEGDNEVETPHPCAVEYDTNTIKPLVLSTWQHTQLGSCPAESAIIPESQVLQESIAIPGTNLHLVYHSSKTSGYMSSILIQLTPELIPQTLALVHLRVTVEGIVLEKLFEADRGLKYRFAWDRTNAYKQKVYGIVTASVKVGYQYQGCSHIFWETRTATMSGYDLTSSEVGGWNLDIHHTYNFQEGILHKGDGTNIYLKEKPKNLKTILGNGRQRSVTCTNCDGDAADSKLLAPVALASGRDGSLYVGDYNYVRKLSPDRQRIDRILELSSQTVPYKYFMTVSPLDGKLYISDPHSKKVLRVKTMGPVRDLDSNLEIIAGTGEQCVPGDRDRCGDGKLASQARLTHPKGIAINKDGIVYFVDGVNIRSINKTGHISTVLGSQLQPGDWNPLPCQEPADIAQVKLHWPTALSINPLDDTLHILDNNMVLRMTPERKIVVTAGHPPHCPPEDIQKTGLGLLSDERLRLSVATRATLISPQNIAFGPWGELYIVESDKQYVNRVRVVSTSGLISHIVGGTPRCNCQDPECKCFDTKETLAASALLNTPTALTVTPDNVLHVADMGNLRVHSIVSSLPTANRYRHYEVMSPGTHEVYTFNRYGQHRSTKNLMTDTVVYSFTYSVNSYYGKLTTVTGPNNNQLRIVRDYTTWAKEIVSPGGQRSKVKMNPLGQLETFTVPGNYSVSFTYLSSSGLLFSKRTDSEHTYFYEYDDNGRVSHVIQPTGEVTNVETDVTSTGAVVKVATDAADVVTMATNGNQLAYLHGNLRANISYSNDGSLVVEYPNNLAVTMETATHPLLDTEHRMQVKRKILGPDNLLHKLEWRFYLRRDGKSRRSKKVERIGRRLRVGESHRTRHGNRHANQHEMIGVKLLLVNGEHVLTIEYDREANTETIMDVNWKELLTIIYNSAGQAEAFVSSLNLKPVNVTLDPQGRMVKWQKGDLTQRWDYDARGQLNKRVKSNGATQMWMYRGGDKPTEIALPSGKRYHFKYDLHGNLAKLTTPNSGTHSFDRLVSVGFHRYLYRLPGTQMPYLEDYTSDGRLLRIQYPSNLRRVYYYYNEKALLEKVISGETTIRHLYNEKSKLRTGYDLQSGNFGCLLDYKPSEQFATSYGITFKDRRYIQGRFEYDYDNNFRISTLKATIGSNELVPLKLSYNNTTGKLLTMRSFVFSYPQYNKVVIRNIHVEITKAFDEYSRLNEVQYKFNNEQVYHMAITYDSVGRLQRWSREIGRGDEKAFDYSYDIDDNIVDVLLQGQSSWKYTYDTNGNLATVSQFGRLKEVLVDNSDRLVSYGDHTYMFDGDGFLIQRNRDVFVYNSQGQLTRMTNGDGRQIWYYYDAHSRLIARKDSDGAFVQFYYGNVLNKNLVTHIYNHSSYETTVLFYDGSNRLMAMEKGDRYYYIATDPMGSPVAIFDSVGMIVKQISYEPFGNVEIDSPPHFEFMFGFHGKLYDGEAGLVFMGDRLYDPMTGRYLTPSYRDIFHRVETELLHNPQSIQSYVLQNPTAVLQHYEELDMKDILSWMNVLGYDMKSLIPSITFDGQIHKGTDWHRYTASRRLLPVTSVFQCAFERDSANFLTMSTVTPSDMMPPERAELQKVAPASGVFGDGLLLSVREGKAVVTLSEQLQPSSNVMSLLLNNSLVVPLALTQEGKDVHYFVKQETAMAAADLQAAGIGAEFKTLSNGVNFSVEWTQEKTNRMAITKLENDYVMVYILYGTTVEKQYSVLLEQAKSKAITQAWAKERHLLLSNQSGSRNWSPEEKEQIEQRGKASGYSRNYIRDVNDFPEMADDPNNIRFS
ncbi:teneurin-m-like isoform X2 [Lingula anatina]|uniref:Teneurin-m-like isoform X2 n=1 Tax=Lingula anatina TaxID=7574 RepID=A0A2R2MLA0_LINAN|nr:teneurin-m-like isoform X2 [Lingula anatina]|eukprot:XP_023930983.1 teneurin-m-like isoform X2 [Lingula anatina]